MAAIVEVCSEKRSPKAAANPAAQVREKPARTAGAARAVRSSSPKYMPETIFSNRCRPGFSEAASTAASCSFHTAAVSRLPHSVLIAISVSREPSSTPRALPIFAACSTYAAFVPVPKITPIAVPGQLYAAAAIVPTVSLASAVTRIFSPRASSCACSSATTSAPIASAAAKPLFHATSVPASMAVCAAGKEKVKPMSPAASPPHSAATKAETQSARKPKSSAPLPRFAASGTLNWRCRTGPIRPPPSSRSCSTRKCVPPRSSAKYSPVSSPVTRRVR
mmetsp:Transcript_46443/g.145257  ORF Transcript_46443/g.145257 Transcript_46443/m.145257 type:complete len:278 (-) Transcript_46443:169-1002(-)